MQEDSKTYSSRPKYDVSGDLINQSTENDFLRVYRAATKPQEQKEVELKTEEFNLNVNGAGGDCAGS